jgi:hypothetical protein
MTLYIQLENNYYDVHACTQTFDDYTTVRLAFHKLFSLKLGSSAAYFSPVSITTHLLRIKVVG